MCDRTLSVPPRSVLPLTFLFPSVSSPPFVWEDRLRGIDRSVSTDCLAPASVGSEFDQARSAVLLLIDFVCDDAPPLTLRSSVGFVCDRARVAPSVCTRHPRFGLGLNRFPLRRIVLSESRVVPPGIVWDGTPLPQSTDCLVRGGRSEADRYFNRQRLKVLLKRYPLSFQRLFVGTLSF